MYLEHKIIATSTKFSYKSVLVVEKLTKGHSGTYKCSVGKIEGEQQIHDITIAVKGEFKFRKMLMQHIHM
jgi:hypothetical protein